MKNFNFNESDDAHTMKQNLDAFLLSLKKNKYKLILKFMNDLFEKDNKSLRDFKNMTISQLSSDDVYNTIENYEDEIKQTLRITIKIDDDTNLKQYVFDLIKNMVKSIDYSLLRVDKGDKHYYTIIDKPFKSTRQLKSNP